ncbi:hypothetical protein C4F51_03105 [Cellvibrio sp. KB43]|uniref:Uncharacterized protein n=1 Tax=Cellvibrio polysaccharolyticus TaxID=2082724 RepID=A0A928UZN8_9GAMM|nr:hypothetical protein [Cellvibrio polysaccharolyticus]
MANGQMSTNQGIRESGNQGIRESGNQGIRESGNQGIRESGNQGIREFLHKKAHRIAVGFVLKIHFKKSH